MNAWVAQGGQCGVVEAGSPDYRGRMDQAPPRPAPAPASAAPPTVGALFRGFLSLGLMGFGGVLPLARHMLVEDRRWLGAAEFADLLGLCQFLPGGNVVNLSVAVGLRFRGVPGALAALTGLLAAPSVVVVLLGAVYDRFAEDPAVRNAFAGLAAAAAGLLVGLAVKLVLPLWRQPVAAGLAGLCFLAVAVLRVPLLPALLVLVPVCVLARRWSRA
jgi:chromate transporter